MVRARREGKEEACKEGSTAQRSDGEQSDDAPCAEPLKCQRSIEKLDIDTRAVCETTGFTEVGANSR
jgi:hypothetical protein